MTPLVRGRLLTVGDLRRVDIWRIALVPWDRWGGRGSQLGGRDIMGVIRSRRLRIRALLSLGVLWLLRLLLLAKMGLGTEVGKSLVGEALLLLRLLLSSLTLIALLTVQVLLDIIV